MANKFFWGTSLTLSLDIWVCTYMYILLSCAALQTSADIPAEVINKKEKAVSLVRKTFKKIVFG